MQRKNEPKLLWLHHRSFLQHALPDSPPRLHPTAARMSWFQVWKVKNKNSQETQVGGWINPSKKYAHQIASSSPKVEMNISKKNVKPPPRNHTDHESLGPQLSRVWRFPPFPMEEYYRFLRSTTAWKLHHLGTVGYRSALRSSQFPIQFHDSKSHKKKKAHTFLRQSPPLIANYSRNPFIYSLLVKLASGLPVRCVEPTFKITPPSKLPQGSHSSPPKRSRWKLGFLGG